MGIQDWRAELGHSEVSRLTRTPGRGSLTEQGPSAHNTAEPMTGLREAQASHDPGAIKVGVGQFSSLRGTYW